MNKLILIALKGIEEIEPGVSISKIIIKALKVNDLQLKNNDIIVIAHKIISKAENQFVRLNSINPTPQADALARKSGKTPELCQVILDESSAIIRVKNGVIISETKHGFVCANAGVDKSNTGTDENTVLLLPCEPDKSAQKIFMELRQYTGLHVPVIINDTQGRPFRNGAVGVAIGVAGIEPLKNYVGFRDMYGGLLHSSKEAVVDELASSATLLMGQSNEKKPVVIVRGYCFSNSSAGISKILREPENDLFR